MQLGTDIALELKSFRSERVVGIGVSIPGLIDRSEGFVVRSPNLRWRDVPVAFILQKKLYLPVSVENDANAAALSELWYGPMQMWSAHCMLFILVVEGIGTGLLLNGEIYVGSRLVMGGFGHIPMDPNGAKCSCGNIGCWEVLASDTAILAHYTRSCNKQAGSVHDVIALAYAGDEWARQALLSTAVILGRGIAALAQGLAPEVIVIGGQITAAWSIIEPTLSQSPQTEYLIPGVSQPRLCPESVEQPSFFGAFPVALRNMLLSGRAPRPAKVNS